MNNKKLFLIIIIAAILAFITASLVFKSSNKPIKLDNNQPAIQTESVEQLEQIDTKNEEITDVKPVDRQKPTTNKINSKPVIKSEEPKITPIQVKAANTSEEQSTQNSQAEPYKESADVIVIPQEYSFKSPAKYSFK